MADETEPTATVSPTAPSPVEVDGSVAPSTENSPAPAADAAGARGANADPEERSEDREPAQPEDRIARIIAGSANLTQAITSVESLGDLSTQEQSTFQQLKEIREALVNASQQGLDPNKIDLSKLQLSNTDPTILSNLVQKEIQDLEQQKQKDDQQKAAQEREDAEKREKETQEYYDKARDVIGAVVGVAAGAPAAGVGVAAMLRPPIPQEELPAFMRKDSPAMQQIGSALGGIGSSLERMVASLGDRAIDGNNGKALMLNPKTGQNPPEAEALSNPQNGLAAGKVRTQQAGVTTA